MGQLVCQSTTAMPGRSDAAAADKPVRTLTKQSDDTPGLDLYFFNTSLCAVALSTRPFVYTRGKYTSSVHSFRRLP